MKFLILITCMTALQACEITQNKDSISERPEFIGYWYASMGYSYFVHLNIDQDGKANIDFQVESGHRHYGGTMTANKKTLYLDMTKYYEIVEYPHVIDTNIERVYVNDPDYMHWKLANWKMVLNGLKPDWLHDCGTRSYYKADY